MSQYFVGDSTVSLGDCVHATSPQLGQANPALVDAWQLSESIKKLGTNGFVSMSMMLSAIMIVLESGDCDFIS